MFDSIFHFLLETRIDDRRGILRLDYVNIFDHFVFYYVRFDDTTRSLYSSISYAIVLCQYVWNIECVTPVSCLQILYYTKSFGEEKILLKSTYGGADERQILHKDVTYFTDLAWDIKIKLQNCMDDDSDKAILLTSVLQMLKCRSRANRLNWAIQNDSRNCESRWKWERRFKCRRKKLFRAIWRRKNENIIFLEQFYVKKRLENFFWAIFQ